MEGTADIAIVTHALTQILGVFSNGAGRLASAGSGLLGTLVAIELTWAGVLWALSPDMPQVMAGFLKRMVKIGVFSLLVLNFASIANVVLDGFIWAGAQVGGGGASSSISMMRNPSAIVEKGFQTVSVAWAGPDTETQTGWVGLPDMELSVDSVMSLALRMVLALIALAMYWVIATQAFLCVLEFYVVAAFGAIFMPFGINAHTKWIAEKYMGAIMAQGTKLMVLTALIGVIAPIFDALKLPDDAGFEHFLSLVIGVATLAVIVWRVPQVAAGMVNGQASLSATAGVAMAAQAGASVAKEGATVVGTAGASAAATGLKVAAMSGVAATSYVAGQMGSGGQRASGPPAPSPTNASEASLQNAVAAQTAQNEAGLQSAVQGQSTPAAPSSPSKGDA